MRIEIIDEGIKIFIQNGFIKNIDWDDKEQVVESIKNLFNKIRKQYLYRSHTIRRRKLH